MHVDRSLPHHPRQWILATINCTRLIAFVSALLVAIVANASEPEYRNSVKHFGADYGLPRGANVAIQTRDGYLWIGTFGGLYRFDGRKATPFAAQHKQAAKLAGGLSGPSSDRILALHQDSTGRLWIGTEDGGISVYENGFFVHSPICAGLCRVQSFAEVPGEAMWVATSVGIMSIDLRTLQSQTLADPTPGTFEYVAIGPDNSVYVGGKKGLAKVVDGQIEAISPPAGSRVGEHLQVAGARLWMHNLNGGTHVTSFDPVTQEWTQSSLAAMLITSPDPRLWVNTDKGEVLMLSESGDFMPLRDLPAMKVTGISTDRDGVVWVTSSDRGLWSVRQEKGMVVNAPGGDSRAAGRAIINDGEGGILLGFDCYAGLRHLPANGDAGGLVPSTLLKNDNRCVQSLLRDRAGGVWAGTNTELEYVSKGRSQRIKFESGITHVQIWQAADGSLWAAVEGHTYPLEKNSEGKFARSTPLPALESMTIRHMSDAWAGGIWFVGDQGAYRLIDGKIVERWTPAEGLSSRFARVLREDQHGTWIGTYGGGLNLVVQGRVHHYDEKNGLGDNTVSCIESDAEGRLWLGGNKGISVMPQQQFGGAQVESIPVKLSSESMSFEINGGRQSSCMRDSAGRLWFSLVQGFIALEPDKFKTHYRAVPTIQIERVTVKNKKMDLDKPVVLGPSNGAVEIEFNAINLTNPDQLRYRYRLNTPNGDWVYSTNAQVISYQDIPWGTQLFEVQAKNIGSPWSMSAKLQIVRPLPWYQRQWLWLLGTMTGLLVLMWRTRGRETSDRRRARVQRILGRESGSVSVKRTK